MYTAKSLRLTQEGAQTIMEAAIRKAREIGVPMSIAIVDDGTNLFLFARMDGGKPHGIKIAQAKARAAASNRMPTGRVGSTGNQLDDVGALLLPLAAGPDMYVTMPGGLTIIVDGQCVGGIGALIRYTQARFDLSPAEGRTIALDTGGLQAGAGIRVIF